MLGGSGMNGAEGGAPLCTSRARSYHVEWGIEKRLHIGDQILIVHLLKRIRGMFENGQKRAHVNADLLIRIENSIDDQAENSRNSECNRVNSIRA